MASGGDKGCLKTAVVVPAAEGHWANTEIFGGLFDRNEVFSRISHIC